MAVGKHIVEHAILGVDDTSTLSGLFVAKAGDTMTGALGIGATPRAGAEFDIGGSGSASIGNVTGATITLNYGSVDASSYYNDGYSFDFRIYGFRNFGGTTVYSPLGTSVTATDNNLSTQYYTVDLTWNALTGVDGYRVVVYSDTYYGASNNKYFDVYTTSVHIDGGLIIETGGTYQSASPPVVTPTSTTNSADWYVTKSGDTISTGHFSFGNLPTLTLGNNNGLKLYGISDYTLTLPTTSILQLGGISLKPGRVAKSGQLIFPHGYGGIDAPGIRMEGGQTDGGLAMSDGIMEFWDNFSYYCTPVPGHLQAVFRLDTRSGYEGEGFIIGGSTPGGVGAVAIGVNYNTFDVNLCYYGYGSVSVGTDVGTAGMSGNGHLGVKYDFYAGRNIIVNSTGGMKIGTATTQKLGFWNATPVVQPSAYTVTNPSADRAFDVSSTSVNELARVLGTLITDLQSIGLLG